jgi:hypothetical protein
MKFNILQEIFKNKGYFLRCLRINEQQNKNKNL